jgi:phenylacetate-CoA ligase
MSAIRAPEFEQMPRPELKRLQSERLRAVVQHVYANVPFYHKAFDERGVKPDQIRSIDDLPRLPFTAKVDFKSTYPYGLLAVPLEQVVRVHASSGTTGKPIVSAYTRNDIGTWAEILARALATAGMTSRDIYQNCQGYGLFTGGLGWHYGAERLGATVVPTATGNTRRQITMMQDLGTTVLGSTPSYALIIAETAREMGVDIRKTKLRLALCGAEPWSEQMRKDIEERLGVTAFDNYGLTEVIGPGVSAECEYHCGLHVPEDHFIVEIVNPQTGEPLPYGETGELVVTTLTKEALPVVRFRTRDITSLNAEPCRCGRTQVRMARVTGRSDDMLIVRGVNVFPSQIESVLLAIEGIEPHYQIIVDRQHAFSYTDLEVRCEVADSIAGDPSKAGPLEQEVRTLLDSVLGISTRVKLLAPRTLARSEGKAKRVFDRADLERAT